MFRLSVMVSLALITLSVTSATQAQTQQYWVAYAIDQKSGAWGLGWGQSSSSAAMNQALSNCNHRGCTGQAKLGRCVAIAKGNTGGFGAGTGNTAEIVQEYAVGYCRQYAPGSSCRVLTWRCHP